jgi:hypothetical protein
LATPSLTTGAEQKEDTDKAELKDTDTHKTAVISAM